jgi:hypothetical protein
MRRITTFCLALAIILPGLTGPAAAQNVSIQLLAYAPIQIPYSGGRFNYMIAAINNGPALQQATIWCMLTLPNGNPYGPVLGAVTITLNPGQTLERQRTQNIPAGAPAGNYSLNAYVGVYPDTIWDSDSFPFEKLAIPGGTELWVARYNGLASESDWANSIALDAGGHIYITGCSLGNYATIKYDGSGNQMWVAQYSGMGYGYYDEAHAVALDAAGNVYVTGESEDLWNSTDYATIKYDNNGNQIWVARYSEGYSNVPHGLAVDAAGNIYVTGESIDLGQAYNYLTIKYDAHGNQEWLARYNGRVNGYDVAYSLALDSAGNAYVTGFSDGGGTSYDFATIKYDARGNQVWEARYSGPGNYWDEATSLAVDGGGNVYVTGYCYDPATANDYVTIKYDPAGNLLWVASFDGSGNSVDEAYDLAVDGAGNVYVTGRSGGNETALDYATIKYDANGNQEWVARYNGSANWHDEANSLALDAAGSVYVTGKSTWFGSATDYTTIKYSNSGEQQWVARYNGPGNGGDCANALAVDAVGNVFVTGESYGSGTSWDYCTIKYSGGNLDNWMPVEATVLGQPLPQECRLEQNFPNPFNASTVLSYKLQAPSHVSLRVYDTAGRLVETLVDGWRSAGTHELTWEAGNLAAGIYFAKMHTGEYVGVQKLILMK